MPDPLATPWSGHRGLALPTVLPSAAGAPAAALVEVSGAAAAAAPDTVLVTPWSSGPLSSPGRPPSAVGLRAPGRAPALPRPRSSTGRIASV